MLASVTGMRSGKFWLYGFKIWGLIVCLSVARGTGKKQSLGFNAPPGIPFTNRQGFEAEVLPVQRLCH